MVLPALRRAADVGVDFSMGLAAITVGGGNCMGLRWGAPWEQGHGCYYEQVEIARWQMTRNF